MLLASGSHNMGSAVSRPRLKGRIPAKELANINSFAQVLTFDALGTLYRFKEPFADQYLNVARRCGMRLSATPEALDKAFKVAFKEISQEYPNYGKGKLDSPQVWWEALIEHTFDQATDGASLPPSLSHELYTHFSSGAAYELFPEVKHMFARNRSYRSLPLKWELPTSNSPHPMLSGPERRIIGVVTNSDPRVIDVLRDLGLKVGVTEPQRIQEETALPSWSTARPRAAASDWNSDNDIDFVCTSYEAGSEKPNNGIFDHALMLADAVGRSLDKNVLEYLSTQEMRTELRLKFELLIARNRQNVNWVHAGDDLEKDYQGASAWGATAYYVKRKARATEEEETATVEGKYLLRNLSYFGPPPQSSGKAGQSGR